MACLGEGGRLWLARGGEAGRGSPGGKVSGRRGERDREKKKQRRGLERMTERKRSGEIEREKRKSVRERSDTQ